MIDGDDREMKITLIRTADGVRRIPLPPSWKPFWQWSDHYWWTEGNAGCDCNRSLEFDRAEDPQQSAGGRPCSDGLFDVEFE